MNSTPDGIVHYEKKVNSICNYFCMFFIADNFVSGIVACLHSAKPFNCGSVILWVYARPQRGDVHWFFYRAYL